MDKAELALSKLAEDHPFHFFTFAETALICGFSERVVSGLVGCGAPVVGKKLNLRILMEWIGKHPEKVAEARRG